MSKMPSLKQWVSREKNFSSGATSEVPKGLTSAYAAGAQPRSGICEPIVPTAFTIPQASHYSGLSRSFIYVLFQQNQLPRLKAGKRVLILRADLDAYLYSIR